MREKRRNEGISSKLINITTIIIDLITLYIYERMMGNGMEWYACMGMRCLPAWLLVWARERKIESVQIIALVGGGPKATTTTKHPSRAAQDPLFARPHSLAHSLTLLI